MEEIFITIMEQIAREMPDLSLIDEDYGQLEMGADEDHYPVTFPCVLIGNTDSNWHDLGYGAQNSESFITVRLAIDCYHDTSHASGTYEKVRERQQTANKLYRTPRRSCGRKAGNMRCRDISRYSRRPSRSPCTTSRRWSRDAVKRKRGDRPQTATPCLIPGTRLSESFRPQHFEQIAFLRHHFQNQAAQSVYAVVVVVYTVLVYRTDGIRQIAHMFQPVGGREHRGYLHHDLVFLEPYHRSALLRFVRELQSQL